jgi:hypothetical protein
MLAPSDTGDLFFEPLVRGYVADNPRFVRRDWLAGRLDGALRTPDKRFVLLTAEPGAGKSTFMAQLAHDRADWLRYFIRRDQRAPLADVSDKSLLLRIGYQLAARHPELFTLDAIRVSVVQTIGAVDEQGEAVGAEIERLTASPFYQKVLQIEQQVRSSAGRVVGLRIEELNVESRLLTVEDLLDLALIAPARALQRADPSQRIVILIDALDEIRYHPGTESSILAWLTNCPDLPENVRFVLSSRPPDDALNLFRDKQAGRLAELEIAEADTNVTQDVQTFVTRLVGEPKFAEALATSPGGAVAFATKATDKAHGNLGYLDALARGIDQAIADASTQTLQALLALDALPAALGGLHAFFLNQIKVSVARERIELTDPETGETYDKPIWPTVYHPILGALAVAMEPLELDVIIRLGGIRADRVWVESALDRLLQFLDTVDGRYRFYHATVGEFLTAETTSDNSDPGLRALYQDRAAWHRRIAASYGALKQQWLGVDWCTTDGYGLRQVGSHLAALRADGDYRVRLYEVVSSPFAVVNWQRFGSLVHFRRTLSIAMAVARGEVAKEWADFLRCYLIECVLASKDVGADAVGFVAACALKCDVPENTQSISDQMLISVSAIESRAGRAAALSAIATFLVRAGQLEEAKRVSKQALEESKSIENIQEKSKALSTIVLDVATIQDVSLARNIARQALAIAQSGNFAWSKAIAMGEVAYALAMLGDQAQAEAAFSAAQSAAWAVPDNEERAYALCAVASAMERAGDKSAQSVFRDATSQLYSHGRPPEEIEEENFAIYLDYRARAGDDLGSLFSGALDIKNAARRRSALDSLATRLATMVLDGNYPPMSRRKHDIDRLCDRATFIRLAELDEPVSGKSEAGLTLGTLCDALVACTPPTYRAIAD